MSSTSWSPRHVDLLAMHTRLQFRVVQKLYTSVQALAHGAAPPVRIPSPACDQPPRLPSPAPRSAGPVPWGLRNATTGACVSTPRAPPPCTCFAGRERRGGRVHAPFQQRNRCTNTAHLLLEVVCVSHADSNTPAALFTTWSLSDEKVAAGEKGHVFLDEGVVNRTASESLDRTGSPCTQTTAPLERFRLRSLVGPALHQSRHAAREERPAGRWAALLLGSSPTPSPPSGVMKAQCEHAPWRPGPRGFSRPPERPLSSHSPHLFFHRKKIPNAKTCEW